MSCASSRSREVVTYFPPPRFPSRRYRRSVGRFDDDISDVWVQRLLADLAQGILLEKVKSRSRRLPRTFFLDAANMVVYYEGSTNKKKGDTTIQISKIREVREGEKDFSKKMKDLQRSHCFAIILGLPQKIKYMLAPDQEMRDKWIRALRYAMQMEQLAEHRNETDRNIREAFNRADINGNGHLDFEDVMRLLKLLNTDIKKKYARQMFDTADKNRNVSKHTANVLDREEFVFFYHSLTRRVEMEEIFLRFSNGKGFMTIQDLLSFLRDGQRCVNANEDQCRDILDQCEPEGSCKKRGQLSLDGFHKFLTSDREQIFNPAHREVYQDMGRLITDYFIASSHNTNLSRDQLVGPSDSKMYIEALKKGCRCVELDCWDGPENDPVIYHGHTLTSKILFRDVIEAINEYAFKTSPYPVILSIENHCSLQQQQVMANIMNSTFGDKIWRKDDDLIETPTPEKLKNKIIIKGNDLRDEAAEMPDNASGVSSNNKVKGQDVQHNTELHLELSKITTMKSVAFKSVETAAQKDPAFTVISFSEKKFEKLFQTSDQSVNRISHHRLIRIYPTAIRIDSSNYNPVPMWNHGCQVVALNYQTSGEAMQLNHGRFMDNGGVGYVLKPSILLSEEKFGVLTGTVSRSANSMKTLKICIISGFQIPKPKDSTKGEIIDPFIKVEVYGVPSDQAEYKTKVIENNGFNPRWYETCSFKLRVPELALVRFTVKDEDWGINDFIGYYCLPVSSIQEGFRHFPLYDKNGNLYSQSLIFTHITLTSA